MNTKPLIITLAVSATVLGAGVVIVKNTAPATKVEASTAPIAPASNSTAAAKPANFNKDGTPLTWAQLESEDYKTYIANLRKAGCPEQTIRDIVLADINKLFAPREEPFKVVRQNTRAKRFEVTKEDLAKLKQLRTVQQEKSTIVKNLLGIDLPVDLLPSVHRRSYSMYEAAFRALPVEKRAQVQALHEQYWQESDDLRERHNNNVRTPEYLGEYAALNNKLKQDLAAALNPAELEDFTMRTSLAAGRVATQFQGVLISDEEFKVLYSYASEYDRATGKVGNQANASPVDDETKKKAQDDLTAKNKALLGDERWSQYESTKDNTSKAMNLLAQKYNLPEETISKVRELQTQVQDQFKGQRGIPITPEIVQQRVEATKNIESQLTTLVGDNVFKALKTMGQQNNDVYNP